MGPVVPLPSIEAGTLRCAARLCPAEAGVPCQRAAIVVRGHPPAQVASVTARHRRPWPYDPPLAHCAPGRTHFIPLTSAVTVLSHEPSSGRRKGGIIHRFPSVRLRGPKEPYSKTSSIADPPKRL